MGSAGNPPALLLVHTREKPTQEEQAQQAVPRGHTEAGAESGAEGAQSETQTQESRSTPCFLTSSRPAGVGTQRPAGFSQNQPWGQGRGQPRAIEIPAPTPLHVCLFCVYRDNSALTPLCLGFR